MEIFKTDDNIKEEISVLSIKNLDIYNTIDLVRKINEEQGGGVLII